MLLVAVCGMLLHAGCFWVLSICEVHVLSIFMCFIEVKKMMWLLGVSSAVSSSWSSCRFLVNKSYFLVAACPHSVLSEHHWMGARNLSLGTEDVWERILTFRQISILICFTAGTVIPAQI